jgi:hypothetical protein
MKKIYSIVVGMLFTATIHAQGTENFDTRTATAGNGYTTSNFNGADGTTWDLSDGRIIETNTNNLTISGTTTLIRDGAGGQNVTFSNGVGTLSFQYKKAFTGGTTRTVQLYVNGTMVNETAGFGTGNGGQDTVYNYSYAINSTAAVTVRVAATGAQVSVDNFAWTAAGGLSVADFKKVNPNFIKNTFVKNDEITFGTDAKDVKVYTLTGQLVKTASVKANGTLNIAELAEGNYIVTGTVNNQAVSQKILKN